LKVLIIDDEEDTRSIAGMSLGLLGGHQVVEAASGREGIEKAQNESPDVILLDLLMPEMDGIATLNHLHKNPATAAIPVIFLTVKGLFCQVDQLRELGALAVLNKPFDPTSLSGQITDILARCGEHAAD
jgi:CheY-like chemotaxis protein